MKLIYSLRIFQRLETLKTVSTFYERFSARREQLRSLLCVGFDPDPNRLPEGYEPDLSGWLEFATDIVSATADTAVAYKPNLAFFEAEPFGWEFLEEFTRIVRGKAPGALLIADAKRGDIQNTARAYARAFFERLDFDAITVNPYMGLETLGPFTDYREKGVIVLGLTSNPGSAQFQLQGTPPLYEQVARAVAEENRALGNLWLVVGATGSADRLHALRQTAPELPFLIPGVGAQGGDAASVLSAVGRDVLINSSRSILYPVPARSSLPEAAGKNAGELAALMRDYI